MIDKLSILIILLCSTVSFAISDLVYLNESVPDHTVTGDYLCYLENENNSFGVTKRQGEIDRWFIETSIGLELLFAFYTGAAGPAICIGPGIQTNSKMSIGSYFGIWVSSSNNTTSIIPMGGLKLFFGDKHNAQSGAMSINLGFPPGIGISFYDFFIDFDFLILWAGLRFGYTFKL